MLPLTGRSNLAGGRVSDGSAWICYYGLIFVKVVDRCDMNKMTAANLAVVFGPNLVWSNDKTMSLTFIGKL